MTIQERIKNDIISAMKNKEAEKRDSLKFLMSRFQNTSKNADKTVSDSEAISIIKNIMKGVKDTQNILIENNAHQTKIDENFRFIMLCEQYLPRQATKEEVEAFISTIDKTKFKNSNAIIGIVVKHFNGNVDGNMVKTLI